MGFGFSSMPSAAQRFGMAQTPNADALAEQAMAASRPKPMQTAAPPQAPPGAPASGDAFGGIQMPNAANVSLHPQPWIPGGVNLPGAAPEAAGAAATDAASGLAGAGGGASFLSTIAALFGG